MNALDQIRRLQKAANERLDRGCEQSNSGVLFDRVVYASFSQGLQTAIEILTVGREQAMPGWSLRVHEPEDVTVGTDQDGNLVVSIVGQHVNGKIVDTFEFGPLMKRSTEVVRPEPSDARSEDPASQDTPGVVEALQRSLDDPETARWI